MKMNSKKFSAENNRKYQEEFCHFLIKRIEKNGGSVQFQHLTGHLSSLRCEVRNTVGTSMPELKSFLQQHSDIFRVHDNVVFLSKSSVIDEKEDSDNYNIESLPQRIANGVGVIVKLFPDYGFIKTKEPVKTSVYFKASHFSNEYSNLMECGLNIGTMVCFNANKEHNVKKFTSKYIATRVWKKKIVDEESIQKPRKKLETGLYDPLKLEGDGFIQNIFPNHGFIAVNGDDNNTVFFHKNRLANYGNIVDLTKFLSKGDLMEFCAHRSTKSDVKARWEATKVWKKSAKSSSKSSENKNQTHPSSTSTFKKNSSQSAINIKHQSITNSEIIRNQEGKICPRTHGAVIKFGENFSELADGDSCPYFNCGTKVLDIGWEFMEGDNVLFDAVKIKSAPGWKAILVWVGEKPDIDESSCIEDFSELTDIDETEIPEENDSTVSNFFSMSSNSSLKSVSVRSELATSKLDHYIQNKNTESFIDKEVKKSSQKNEKLYLSTSSRSSSYNSLSSTDSKSFQMLKKELSSTRVHCSKEGEYKNEKSYLSTSSQSSSHNSLSSADSKSFQMPKKELSSTKVHCSKEKENKSKEHTYSVEDMTSTSFKESISDNIPSKHSQKCMIERQDDDDLKTALNYLKAKDSDAYFKDDNTEKKSKSTELCPENFNSKASIKRYQNVLGSITKVYSTFAEVNSSELLKPVAFFTSVFYCNKISAKELELSTLQEVLKIGDTIYFNYFEIVDDLSQNWCKISMAWKGEKPRKAIELTPEDFIRQQDLTVTVKKEISCIKTIDVSSKKFLTSFEDFTSDNEIVSSNEKPTVSQNTHDTPHKKFLTSFEDCTPDCDAVECISLTESCIDHDEIQSSKQTDLSELETSLNDIQELPSRISEILKHKKPFLTHSQVDLTALAVEIIDLILKDYIPEENEHASPKYFLPAEIGTEKLKSDIVCSSCGRKSLEKICKQNPNQIHVEVQTFITGDVMAQNIFTD